MSQIQDFRVNGSGKRALIIDDSQNPILSVKHIGIGCLETRRCGCRIKRYKGGRSYRSGCDTDPSGLMYNYPINSCGDPFETRDEYRKHLESHRI